MRFEGADGVALAADVEGPAAGWPVTLLHGGGQTRHAWRGVVDALVGQGWRCFAVDLRGHGDSDWAKDGDYTVDAYARDCAALVGQFDRPPVLVGASLGGVISVIAEGELRPGGSTALVVADIAPDLNLAGIARVRNFMGAHDGGFSSLKDASEAIAAYTGKPPRSSSTAGLLRVLRQREDGRWYWHWDPRVLTSGLGDDAPVEVGARMGAALERVTVPTLLVRGLVSDVVTAQGAEDFVLRAPNAERADVGGAGHMVAGDQNDAFAEATLSFLDRRVRPLLALDG
jgi:pimeloyl-ACP methyl ester carboxylesterase